MRTKKIKCIEGMKDWLQNRQHSVSSEDNFLLCDNCREEFDCESKNGSLINWNDW